VATRNLQPTASGDRDALFCVGPLRENSQASAVVDGNEILEAVLDSLPDAVFIVESNGIVGVSNVTARSRFGLERGACVANLGLKWLTLLLDEIERTHLPIRAAGYSGAIQLTESGYEQFLVPTAVPVMDDNSELAKVIVTLVDVTGVRRVDEANSRPIDLFSHELRTPLHSLRMGVGLISGGKLGPLTTEQRQALRIAQSSIERLCLTVENVLTVARAGAQSLTEVGVWSTSAIGEPKSPEDQTRRTKTFKQSRSTRLIRAGYTLACGTALTLLLVDSPFIDRQRHLDHAIFEAVPLLLVGVVFLLWLFIERPSTPDLIKQTCLGLAFIFWGIDLLLPPGPWVTFLGAVVIAIYVFDLVWMVEGKMRQNRG
jgi:His Kinase A (phospho-acceptor) domain